MYAGVVCIYVEMMYFYFAHVYSAHVFGQETMIHGLAGGGYASTRGGLCRIKVVRAQASSRGEGKKGRPTARTVL